MEQRYPEQVRPMPDEGLTPNAELTAQARRCLAGKWKFAVLAALIYCLIAIVPSSIEGIGWIIGLIIDGPLLLGLTILFLALVRRGETKLDRMFEGFRRFTTALAAYLLMMLFIVLWSLLLIVPGIVAALSYSMTFFILADEPDLAASAALARSKALMAGRRWKLFYLGCRFLPWALLCLLTAGIGFLWLFPYLQTSMALFYEDIKTQPAGTVKPDPV